MTTIRKPALIVVDYQHGFASPDGWLSVTWWHTIWNTIKQLVDLFTAKWRDVIFTWDDHPADHISFAENHGVAPLTQVNWETVWPTHCVRDTEWAKLYAPFDTWEYAISIKKGYKKDIDSYSWFGWVTLDETMTLDEVLQSKWITDTYVVWLATDWCSWDTALDSANNWYRTTFVTDANKWVNDEASEAKIQKMRDTKKIILQTAKKTIATLLAA